MKTKMKITIFPKTELEAKWAEDKKLYSPDADDPPMCLRCGRKLDKHLAANALSRYANVVVCSECCGTDEAMRDYTGNQMSLCDWYAVRQGLVQSFHPAGGAVLTPICSFKSIFEGPKKTPPLNSFPVPASKVLHSRSDYDGHKWWRTWHPCHEEPLGDVLCGEINDFSESLMDLPEFANLETLRCFGAGYAARTTEPTEFNMYTETEHFNIWLRMITRRGDYNLYVNFYIKDFAGAVPRDKFVQ